MSDTAQFFLALLLVSLSECGVWVRRTTLGLRRGLGRPRVLHPPEVLGNAGAGLLLGSPLPGVGLLLLAHQWPASLGPDGLVAGFEQALDPAWRPTPCARAVAYEQLEPLDVDAARVLSGGVELLRAGSPGEARRLRGLLAELVPLSREARRARIGEALDGFVDAARIGVRVAAHARASRSATWGARLLGLHTFVVAPLLGAQLGLARSWVALLVVFALVWLFTLQAFARAHRRLYPAAAPERRELVALMSLLPLLALRAPDLLARPVLEGCDPVLAMALLGGDRAREHVERALRDLAHPVGAYGGATDERAGVADDRADDLADDLADELADERAAGRAEDLADETRRWFREAYASRLRRALAQAGCDVEAATRAPPREAHATAWCPRCRGQFVRADARCDACGDLALRRFPGGSVAALSSRSTAGP